MITDGGLGLELVMVRDTVQLVKEDVGEGFCRQGEPGRGAGGGGGGWEGAQRLRTSWVVLQEAGTGTQIVRAPKPAGTGGPGPRARSFAFGDGAQRWCR